MYLLVTVICNIDKIKAVLKALKNIDVNSSIVIDSMGTNNIENNYLGYRPAIESSLMSISDVAFYRKTILSIIDSEEKVELAMDTIEKELGRNMKKPNTGIMFTVPLVKF